MKNTDIIKNLSFFSQLSSEDLEKIANISTERNYKKNMIIFLEGEPGEAFYFIKSGKVKIFRTYEDGKEHIIHIFNEGNAFGEATLFSSVPYPASAMAYEDAVIGMIKNSDLEYLIKQNSDIALKIIKVLTQKLIFSQEKIKNLAFNDVYSRTATLLLKLSKEYGMTADSVQVIDIQLSRQELAEMVGTTRETISRIISKFKKEKSITEIDDKIVIIDEAKLNRWI